MPRELDVEEMATDSSTVTDLDVASNPPEGQVEAPASSSAATDEPKDTLALVRDVVETRAKTETDGAASSAEGEVEAGLETGGQATKKEPDDEDYSDVPFHKHPRFQHLLRKAKANEADAGRYQNVQTFLDTNGVSADEAADILVVAALAKTNPAKAWEMAKPWVQGLLIASGEVLPDDLHRRVQKGELSQEAALELSRSNARATSFEKAREFETKRTERNQELDAHRALVGAVQEWEDDRRKKDPNYEAKHDRVMDRVAFLHATEGKPSQADVALDQLKRAYEHVNKQIRSIAPAQAVTPGAPARPAIRPVTGGQVAGNARPEPKDTLGIIQQVVSQRRAR